MAGAAGNPYRGRPLVFLAGCLASWVLARGYLLHQPIIPKTYAETDFGRTVLPGVTAEAVSPTLTMAGVIALPPALLAGVPAATAPASPAKRNIPPMAPAPMIARPDIVSSARAQLLSVQPPPLQSRGPVVRLPEPSGGPSGQSFGPNVRLPAPPSPLSHLRGSGWLLWRNGSGALANGLVAPQYGGSQAGLRLAYPAGSSGAELYARGSAALALPGKELAVGIAYRPLRTVNITIAAEQRVALDSGARTAPALLAYGGFGPRTIGGVDVEGYAQGGVVGVKQPVYFADGALSARRQIAAMGPVPIAMGARVSAGTQDGIGRVDAGPLLEARLDKATGTPMRLSLEWRQRIAGEAAPASGPALVLATDF